MKKIYFLYLLLVSLSGFTQDVIIKGNISDINSEKHIPSVHIYTNNEMIGTISNTRGDFILKFPKSIQADTLYVSHIAYQTKKISLSELSDSALLIYMTPIPMDLPEVSVVNLTVRDIFDSIKYHLNDNYYSKPILQDAYLRIVNTYKSTPKSFNTGTSFGEFALKIYKAPYNQRKANDQIKYIEWQKNKDLGSDNIYYFLYPKMVQNSDILKDFESRFVFNKKWLKAHSILIKGLVDYPHGQAYNLSYSTTDLTKDKPYKGSIWVDKNTFAVVYHEKKYQITSDKSDKTLDAYHLKNFYEKLNDKWVLSNIELIIEKTEKYYNKGLQSIYFDDENEKLENAILNERHHISLVVNKIDTTDATPFQKEELLRLRDVKPFVLSNTSEEFNSKYNGMSNSDIQ